MSTLRSGALARWFPLTRRAKAGIELNPESRAGRAAPAVHERTGRTAANDQAAVAFEHVSKRFPNAAPDAPPALDDVSLGVAPGEVFGIIGRSGAGKSTLLRLINGLERPTSGVVRVQGADVGALDGNGLVKLRRRIGMVFQHFNLLSAKTVHDNIALPLKIAGVPKADIEARVDELLELVGLSGHRDAWPARLSGGQKQRVGIARALVHRPDILLCDEATSALDPETTRSILALLRDINRRLGVTIVLITHEMEVIRDVCDTVAVIERGEVVETGPVWRVFGDPQHEATRALLHLPERALPEEVTALVARVAADTRAESAAAGTHDTPAVGQHVLLEVKFTGQAEREPDLTALSRALGGHHGTVRILQGGIERIQGRAQGRLLVAASLAAEADAHGASREQQTAALLDAARAHADRIEVLAYV